MEKLELAEVFEVWWPKQEVLAGTGGVRLLTLSEVKTRSTGSGWDGSGWDNSDWDGSGWDNSGWDGREFVLVVGKVLTTVLLASDAASTIPLAPRVKYCPAER